MFKHSNIASVNIVKICFSQKQRSKLKHTISNVPKSGYRLFFPLSVLKWLKIYKIPSVLLVETWHPSERFDCPLCWWSPTCNSRVKVRLALRIRQTSEPCLISAQKQTLSNKNAHVMMSPFLAENGLFSKKLLTLGFIYYSLYDC